ncbi:MAG: hypothetical protein P8X85_01555 [Desulfobacterales bacterium]
MSEYYVSCSGLSGLHLIFGNIPNGLIQTLYYDLNRLKRQAISLSMFLAKRNELLFHRRSAAGGSERIRHRCKKTSFCTKGHRAAGCQDTIEDIGMKSTFVFLLRGLGREFVRLRRTGGEMIIHGAHHSKNTPIPELVN